jgi:hypothetical protein
LFNLVAEPEDAGPARRAGLITFEGERGWEWDGGCNNQRSDTGVFESGIRSNEGIICAVAVGRRVGGELVVDPSGEEEEVEAAGCFGFLVTRNLGHQETTSSFVHTSWREGGLGSSG